MSHCIVCGFKTDRRYKGRVIHPMVLKKAREMVQLAFDEFNPTMRKKLKKLQRDFQFARAAQDFKDGEEKVYEEWVKQFFKTKE